MTTVDVGDATITLIDDARGSFPVRALFPDHDDGWGFPELLDDERNWRPPIGCYLVRTPDTIVLVDTGIGPGDPALFGGLVGTLPDRLEALGVGPDAVDYVFHTHLHFDHVGWSAEGERARFPRARYVVSYDDWRSEQDAPRCAHRLAPLEPQLLWADGLDELAPGLSVTPSPGHTPGHQSLCVSRGGRRAFLIGDVALHPAQVADPRRRAAPDADAALAAATREAEFARLEEAGAVVGAAHFGFGRIVGGEWRPLAE